MNTVNLLFASSQDIEKRLALSIVTLFKCTHTRTHAAMCKCEYMNILISWVQMVDGWSHYLFRSVATGQVPALQAYGDSRCPCMIPLQWSPNGIK